MQLALDASFGSVLHWRTQFVACATTPGGGAGAALLVFQPRDGALAIQWAADPATAAAGGVPILALDMGALAHRARDGTAAGAEVDACMARIDWAAVHGRYQRAVHAASEPLGAGQDAVADAVLLDVRRAGAYANAQTMLPGACWRDPATVAQWAAALPAGRAVVVYCVHGHEVSRATAMRLQAAGRDARFLRGGLEGWRAANRPLVHKPG
ncbi:rhodanese-like domain-containing protein [Rubrivivax sp. RP6-9]|uniref:rhodanese-like domain-containing protein n=1 Tax=Rubrivivax sp. RP6-9 TaxID=3415750 RepID=UPI003CC5A90F